MNEEIQREKGVVNSAKNAASNVVKEVYTKILCFTKFNSNDEASVQELESGPS